MSGDRTSQASEQFDVVIVGGGSAGCVLANRLSASGNRSVLLVEAGEDTPDGAIPDSILDSRSGIASRDPRFIWSKLRVTTEAISPGRPRPRLVRYEQARVLGGGSAINGQLANRGSPADYDAWQQLGASGWTWASVLPYFKKVERDLDFEGDHHGAAGKIPVRRVFQDCWGEHAKAVASAFEQAGFRYIPDQNADYEDGYFPLAITNAYDRRVSAAMGYLGPTVRARPNLTIWTQTQVSELTFDGQRCTGIKAERPDGSSRTVQAGEVIVSCGALNSPAMLLRAGIGPAAHLQELGIPLRADRPGVGQGLMDHPAVSLGGYLKPHARRLDGTRRTLLLGLRFSSGLAGFPSGDLGLTVSTKSGWHAIGTRIASMTLWVNRTASKGGSVRLASRDWRDLPIVDFNLLSDRADLERLKLGYRKLAEIHRLAPIRAVMSNFFAASFSDKVRKVSEVNLKNYLLTQIGAVFLDGPNMLRDFMFRRFITENADLDKLLADDAALEAYIKRQAVGVWHATSSCRMGAESDPMAVTRNDGTVIGVDGLRVVDASIIPLIPGANTNFPTLMLAERIADMMQGNLQA